MKNQLWISTLALALLMSHTLSMAAEGGQWARFRGPNGAGGGEATTVPVKWTDADYNWQVTLPGVGHSSPVVWGNRLFVTCGEKTTAKRTVLCLDTANGKTLWAKDYASKPFSQNSDSSYASATPAADAEGVIVIFTTPDEVTVLALDNSGNQQWLRKLGPYATKHGNGGSPILVEGLVIFNNDQEMPKGADGDAPKKEIKSFLVALDRKTGEPRWKLDRRTSISAAYMTPCVRQGAEGRPELVLSDTAHGMTGVDAATGKVNWELGGLFTQRCIVSPVLAGDLIIAGDGIGGVGNRLVAVRPPAKGGKPELVYEIKKPVPFVPVPLVLGERVYLWGDDGKISCVNAATGKQIWNGRISGNFYSSPVCAGGKIYGVSKTGEVIVLGTGDKLEELARMPLGDKSFATPAVADGVMYLRTFTKLFAIGGKVKKP